ncbi:MAG: MBL fold metallo-hydrolase, partial [Phycisphaerales bacterium]|nr:MBL fold metallo-hydrolase [Phycisphaerales bacterium]
DGRVVVISGDTVPCPGLVDLARDADLLVQCCHFPESAVADPAVGAMTERTLPSAGQIGPLAAAAGVKHVVLTHLSMRVRGPGMLDALRADVARSYDGRITVGEDLAVFDV